MVEELSKKDIENAVRLLRTVLVYPSRTVENAENKFFDRLDIPDDDVLRWEDEGGPVGP